MLGSSPSITNQQVSFWPASQNLEFGHLLPLLLATNVNPVGGFPDRTPSLDSVRYELALSRSAWCSVREKEDQVYFNLLVGRLVVSGRISANEGDRYRLWVNKKNGIEFANNLARARIMSKGFRLSHEGIRLVTGTEFRQFEQTSFFGTGDYARVFLRRRPTAESPLASGGDDDDAALTASEMSLLETVQQYVDSEYEKEQETARALGGFTYIRVEPEARPQIQRTYYRLTLLDADYQRLVDQKPSMLALGEPDEEPVTIEVIDLEPKGSNSDIIIGVRKQVSKDRIPATGNLYLQALPTQKNVRTAVLEQLSEGSAQNRWLLPVASESYQYPIAHPQPFEFPPSEYPPNPSQVDAIYRGAGTPDYTLVLGPPGTGKTTVILRWVEYFVKSGKRILITSQNNKAVDNVLERLAGEEGIECVRLGNEAKVSNSVLDLTIDRFALTLQKRLTSRLDERLRLIQEYLTYHEQLLSVLSRRQQRLAQPEYRRSVARWQETRERFERLEASKQQAEHAFQTALQVLAVREQHVQLLTDALASLAQKSTWNPKRWIVMPLTWVQLRWQQRMLVSQRHMTATLQKRHDDIAAERKHLEQSNAQARIDMDSFLQLDRSDLPQAPVAPLPELAVINPDALTEHAVAQSVNETNQQLIRAGRVKEILDAWRQSIQGESQEALFDTLLSMVDVVGATCIGINTNPRFKSLPFDVVIVDESGQIQIQNVIVPLSRAPRAILVGDHKQLPPVVDEELRAELDAREVRTDLLEKSWFEWLWEHSPEDRKTMLDTQFRCPAVISDFVSKAFYGGKYRAGTGMDKKQPLFDFVRSPVVFLDTADLPRERRYEKSRNAGDREEVMHNAVETELVVNVLKRAIGARPELADKGEIGVIVPYANHVRQLQQQLQRARKDPAIGRIITPLKDLVASVDSYQGQERDLIILAFTRSNGQGKVGFLKDWRRLNVAMTRAKKQLIMIGDLSTLAREPRSEKAHDYEFKQAMIQLKAFVKARCHYIPASEWLES